MTILVTGGAGFIGSNFVLDWLSSDREPVVNLDALTYAGSRSRLASLDGDPRHLFVHGDVCDPTLLERLLREHGIRAVVHFAAESHVDRSATVPETFVRTNVVGTFTLLEAVTAHWRRLPPASRENFRFLHVSTDEVFGSLRPGDPPFTEEHAFAPNNPYAASKAGADHLVRAWHRTHQLPVLITNCSNNYGPFQHPEKLIPLVIMNAMAGQPIPLYGDGLHVRDWLHVQDHCAALRVVLERGRPGERYNIGAGNERTNLAVATRICELLDRLRPAPAPRARLITHVKDRPGHDRRYAIDAAKIRRELGWAPRKDFEQALDSTVRWYLANQEWLEGFPAPPATGRGSGQ